MRPTYHWSNPRPQSVWSAVKQGGENLCILCQQRNKETNKQTNKQTNQPTNKQTNKQTNQQTNKQTSKQTSLCYHHHQRMISSLKQAESETNSAPAPRMRPQGITKRTTSDPSIQTSKMFRKRLNDFLDSYRSIDLCTSCLDLETFITPWLTEFLWPKTGKAAPV